MEKYTNRIKSIYYNYSNYARAICRSISACFAIIMLIIPTKTYADTVNTQLIQYYFTQYAPTSNRMTYISATSGGANSISFYGEETPLRYFFNTNPSTYTNMNIYLISNIDDLNIEYIKYTIYLRFENDVSLSDVKYNFYQSSYDYPIAPTVDSSTEYQQPIPITNMSNYSFNNQLVGQTKIYELVADTNDKYYIYVTFTGEEYIDNNEQKEGKYFKITILRFNVTNEKNFMFYESGGITSQYTYANADIEIYTSNDISIDTSDIVEQLEKINETTSEINENTTNILNDVDNILNDFNEANNIEVVMNTTASDNLTSASSEADANIKDTLDTVSSNIDTLNEEINNNQIAIESNALLTTAVDAITSNDLVIIIISVTIICMIINRFIIHR